jgi:CRISPR/Cas system-associated endonuclease Cas3-HD
MKKGFLFIFLVVSVLHAYAQDVDSSASITIDDLSLKLEKLQHDYDYLTCDFELYRLKSELDGLSQDANIKANGVLINIYNSQYNRELYTAYTRNYDAYCALFDTLKEKYEHLKTMVMLKIVKSIFSDTQLSVINATFNSIDKSIATVDSALDYYNYVVKAYRDNR